MVKGLIIIDMVKSYKKDTYNPKEILANQILLIKKFRMQNLPVIIVKGDERGKINPVMQRLWGDESKKNGKKGLNELVPAIMSAERTKLVKKKEYDSFFRTDLEKYCKKEKIDVLYFCGVYSGVCVYFSAAGAAMRGIQPYLVTDASSTEKPSWHKRNCQNFKTILGPLIKTKELIKLLEKEKQSA